MAAAGERPQIEQAPDERGAQFAEMGEGEKAVVDPVQVDHVGLRRRDGPPDSVAGPVQGEIRGHAPRVEGQRETVEALAQQTPHGGEFLREGFADGGIVAQFLTDDQAGIDARLDQRAMEAVGAARGAAGEVGGGNVDDAHDSTGICAGCVG